MLSLGSDEVLFIFGTLHTVKVGGSLDTEIVGFGSTRGKYDFFGGGTDEGGYLGTCIFDDSFGFPAEGVCSGVGISVRSNLLIFIIILEEVGRGQKNRNKIQNNEHKI